MRLGLSQDEIDALSGGGGGSSSIPANYKTKIDTLLPMIASNMEDVFKTLLGNDDITIKPSGINKNTLLFMNESLGENILACPILKSDSSNDSYIIFSLKNAAQIADLMMMGTGEVEFDPTQHSDAIGELINQVLGLLSTGLTTKIGSTISFGQVTPQVATVMDIDVLNYKYAINLHTVAKAMFESNILLILSEEFLDDIFPETKPKQSSSDSPKNQSTTDTSNNSKAVLGQPAEFPHFTEQKSNIPIQNLELLLDVTLELSVELGRTKMPVKQILELGPGYVIDLKKLAGEPVEVLVNNRLIAKGEVVVLEEYFGVRITSLVSKEERIKSLGG